MKYKESASFLKKRSKKLLFIWATGVQNYRLVRKQSFFCFFFVHKKEVLSWDFK